MLRNNIAYKRNTESAQLSDKNIVYLRIIFSTRMYPKNTLFIKL